MATRNDYPTPTWAIKEIKPHVDLIMSGDPTAPILEPSCGTGNIIKTFPQYKFLGVELNSELKCEAPNLVQHYNRDYLSLYLEPRFRCCIMNPPYSHALEFVEKATNEARHVFAFLKMAFLESEKRNAFLKRRMPSNIYVFPNRVSSTSDGNSDNAVRAWFHWGPGVERIDTQLHLLPLRSKDERK